MNKALEHLRFAANRLLRGRIEIPRNTPISRAVDKAIEQLDALITGKKVPDVHQTLADIVDGLGPFKSENEDVSAALLDLIEAQSALNDTVFEVAPDGDATKKPRR